MKMNMGMYDFYVIADLHLGHKNAIKFDERPYYDVADMNKQLIRNIHNTVPKKGTVILNGDFMMTRKGKKGIEEMNDFLDRIDRKIIHVRGNHDDIVIDHPNVISQCEILNVKIKDPSAVNGVQNIIISHYPILVWDKKHHASWHCHGHCHGGLSKDSSYENYYDENNAMDVGANCINYHPITYREVKDVMAKKKLYGLFP